MPLSPPRIRTSPSISLRAFPRRLKLGVRSTNNHITDVWQKSHLLRKEFLCLSLHTRFIVVRSSLLLAAASAKPGNKRAPAAPQVLSAADSHPCSRPGAVTEAWAFQTEQLLRKHLLAFSLPNLLSHQSKHSALDKLGAISEWLMGRTRK